jgi:hypothetical protein
MQRGSISVAVGPFFISSQSKRRKNMNRTEKKQKKRIVKDMKECFRSFHLSVNDIKSPHADEMNAVFSSQLCNDNVCAVVGVTYGWPEGYVGMDAAFHFKVPSERMTEAIQLLNLLNGISPLFGYAICQCCNGVSMHASLLLPDGSLPQGKFKRLIHEMLEDAYFSFPLIVEVINGGNPDDLGACFMEGYGDLKEIGKGISNEVAGTILSDMESVLHDLEISIRKEDRHDDVLAVYFKGPEQFDFNLCLIMGLLNDRALLSLDLIPSFTIPDEKIALVTESVIRINKNLKFGCMYIDRENKWVKFRMGIMIDNGVLDKMEFRNAVDAMLPAGGVFFSIIKEQLSSNESLEALLAKHLKTGKNCHQQSE